MQLPSWHPAFDKEKKLPDWHPAFCKNEEEWIEKGWVTIGGRHMYFNDESGGGGKRGGHAVFGTHLKNPENLVTHGQPTDMMRVAQYKRLINAGHKVAPIRVTKESSGKWGVLDGHQKLEAYRQLGHKLVPTVEHEKMSEEDNKQYEAATRADREQLGKF